MRILVLGARGFPNVQGGVEKHCENLYILLAQKGLEVIVLARRPYVGRKTYEYKGVKIIPFSCPKNKFLETFVHTFNGILRARKYKPDLIHVHAVGPGLFVPLARAMGFKVVITHHGPDYERKKWGRLAKVVLKFGEYFGCASANKVIAVSGYIAHRIGEKYGRIAAVIPNGVMPQEVSRTDNALKHFGLEKGKYVLSVGRLVPEKGLDGLIEAFTKIQVVNWKLVIAGDADHKDKYSQKLKELAKNTSGVVLAGFVSGQPLQELYSHAGLFVLPSYYEGLPIALLEAMSYGLSCIASDIPANRNVGLSEDRFFKPGDIQEMTERIRYFADRPLTEEEKTAQIRMVAEKYDWERIAEQTLEVYKQVLCKNETIH